MITSFCKKQNRVKKQASLVKAPAIAKAQNKKLVIRRKA
jgi:hypothetical protein